MVLTSATHLICSPGMEHGLGIHAFGSIWPGLIIKVFAIRENFFSPSVINCIFIFRTTNIFGIMAQRELVKTTLYVHLCGFQIAHKVNQCTMCQRTNYHNTTNHSGYLNMVWTALVTWYLRRKLTRTSILQNFDSSQ